MITISLCMIVRNEEAVLRRCLDSVSPAVDEIIVVDTGSTDATKEIARHCGAHVYDFPWQEDFSAARNYSFSLAKMDYCLWLDADDVVETDDLRRLLALKETLPPDTDLVMLPYHTAFDEEGQPVFVYDRERLIRRAAGFRWEGAVHEAIAPQGKVVYGDAAITHRKEGSGDPDRNLRIYRRLLAEGKPLSPRDQFYYARELTTHGLDQEAVEVLTAFLDSGQGWVENQLEACRTLSECYERLGKPEEAFKALVRALRFEPPRAELCCALGLFFFRREAWRSAIYWYEQAMTRPDDSRSGGFTCPDCRNYIPALQLCVCWHRLGDMVRAEQYNDLAGTFKPHGQAYTYNREYFSSLRGQCNQ